jgi:hypothetical protein
MPSVLIASAPDMTQTRTEAKIAMITAMGQGHAKLISVTALVPNIAME